MHQHGGQNLPQEKGAACPESTEFARGSLRHLKLFSLNDYLGLSAHPDVAGAAASAVSMVGLRQFWRS